MKAIVFDMDGVLFDTERIYFEAWYKVAAEMDLDISEVLSLCAGHNNADITTIFNESGTYLFRFSFCSSH